MSSLLASDLKPFAAAVLASVCLSASAESIATAPIVNFKLPTFTSEGYRSMLLHGGEAVIPDAQKIDVKQMHLTLFNKKRDEKVTTIFLSTFATFYPQRQFAEGDKGVRVIRDEVEASGERWSYDHKTEKIEIDGDVHVTFRDQLTDILK